MRFYVYVDWTNETFPRPFYVGLGSFDRVQKFRRNWSHTSVKKKFGMTRVVAFESDDRLRACNEEICLTKILHTYVEDSEYNGIGANLTPGGDHPGEFSKQTREKQSQSAKCRPAISERTRQKLRNRPFTFEHRKKLSVAAQERAKTGRLEWNVSREKAVYRLDESGNLVSKHTSINSAAIETNISRSLISQVLNGHRRLAKGYRWEYVK